MSDTPTEHLGLRDYPEDALYGILSFLPDPVAPVHTGDGPLIARRLTEQPKLTVLKDKGYERHGWLPSTWVCRLWRSIILSQKWHHVPLVPRSDMSISIIRSFAPLPIDLYIDEKERELPDSRQAIETVIGLFGTRLHAIHLWTSGGERSLDDPVLFDGLRAVQTPALQKFYVHCVESRLAGLFGGNNSVTVVIVGHSPGVPLPASLGSHLQILDLNRCKVVNPSALQSCAPKIVCLRDCQGFWGRDEPHPFIVDGVPMFDPEITDGQQFGIPIKCHLLRVLRLFSGSLPSAEVLAAVGGQVSLPVLEELELSGFIPDVERVFEALVFPPTASVYLSCTYGFEEVDLSSRPLVHRLAVRYSEGDAVTSFSWDTMKLDVKEGYFSLECVSARGTLLAISFRDMMGGRPAMAVHRRFEIANSFLGGALAIFADAQALSVYSSIEFETDWITGEQRRCRWVEPAAVHMMAITDLALTPQAAKHFLEYCEKQRAEGNTRDTLSQLERLKLLIPSPNDTQYTSPLGRDILLGLRAESSARETPFQVVFDEGVLGEGEMSSAEDIPEE
ncbi:unnamed protein product [Peniophora sp. CBMAI 1063]|nr:unnamed protein product [Peniophora sp. CBMAI 1063]